MALSVSRIPPGHLLQPGGALLALGEMKKECGHLDKHKFVETVYAKSGATPTGYCARFVHDAMSSAGLNLPSIDAWQYSHQKGPLLIAAGFVQVSVVGYQPQVGDIVIWLPCLGAPVEGYPKGAKHIYGHIQVYTGRSDYPWVSDFKQHEKSLPGLPGASWQTKRAVYEIYRYIS